MWRTLDETSTVIAEMQSRLGNIYDESSECFSIKNYLLIKRVKNVLLLKTTLTYQKNEECFDIKPTFQKNEKCVAIKISDIPG